MLNGVLDELIFETLSAAERATLIVLLGKLRIRARELLDTTDRRGGPRCP